MADLNLNIQLVPEQVAYEPGSRLTGNVIITAPSGAWKADSVELVLFWRTSGIGTRDTGVGGSMVLAPPGSSMPQHFSVEFDLEVPLEPYTYHGKIIKIDWFLGLRVKKGWLSKQEVELPLIFRPVGMPLESSPGM